MIRHSTICNRLYTLDRNWRKTISELAEGHPARISTQATSAWVNGDRLPNLGKLGAIADYYGVSVGYILGEVDRIGDERERFADILKYIDTLRKDKKYTLFTDEIEPYSERADTDEDNEHGYVEITIRAWYDYTNDIHFIKRYIDEAIALEHLSLPDDRKQEFIKIAREMIVNAARPVESEG